MNANQRLVFVHIPKSAGISVFRALQNIYTKPLTLRFADSSNENRNIYLSMNREELRRYYFITGHFPFPLYLNKPLDDYKIVTVVRDPIDRELSAYYYMKTWPKHPRYEEVRKMDLYEYLDDLEKSGKKNVQCWHICEKPSFEESKKLIDKHMFLSAPVEYLNEFCTILQHRLGLPEIIVSRENTTAFRFTQRELNDKIINRFKALTEEDEKLYLYIKEKFEAEALGEFRDIIKNLSAKNDSVLADDL